MWHIVNQLLIILIACAFGYELVRQIQETINVVKSNNYNTKTIIVSIICSISYVTFFVSFVLNIIIYFTRLSETIFASIDTSSLCIISIIIFLVSKYSGDYINE